MTDQPVDTESPSSEAPAILEMVHITKDFPGVRALDDVSIRVRRAEIHAICGENGAGKRCQGRPGLPADPGHRDQGQRLHPVRSGHRRGQGCSRGLQVVVSTV